MTEIEYTSVVDAGDGWSVKHDVSHEGDGDIHDRLTHWSTITVTHDSMPRESVLIEIYLTNDGRLIIETVPVGKENGRLLDLLLGSVRQVS